jgi:6-phosphogluconate dehydrogenase (decarboxylating)
MDGAATGRGRVGVIGTRADLALRAAAAGLEVAARLGADTATTALLERAGIRRVAADDGFATALEHPRIFLLDMPPGAAIDALIDSAYLVMEPGDVIIDASGSYWGDTLRRYRRMRHRSIFYLDLAEPHGLAAPAMLLAGDPAGIALATPLMAALAAPHRVVSAGGAGAAHFALAVVDALRSAVGQAAGEALHLLEAYPNELDAAAVAAAVAPMPTAATGRGAWLLDDAVRLDVAVPLLAQALMLERGAALDAHRLVATPPRLGPFVHPDEIL